jgi:uncharacterized protein YuzE
MTMIDYDPEADSLLIRVVDGKYKRSERYGDLIVDLSPGGYVLGFEILNASKFFDEINVCMEKKK